MPFGYFTTKSVERRDRKKLAVGLRSAPWLDHAGFGAPVSISLLGLSAWGWVWVRWLNPVLG